MICLLCAGPLRPGDQAVCGPCLADLPRIGRACPRCARPLAPDAACGPCSVHVPAFDGAIARFHYAPPVDTIVKEFKYGGRLIWAELLARELAAAVRAAELPRPDCLVPVPLHWRRRWARGFNQAAEISRQLARLLDIPMDQGLLRRGRWTAVQAGLPAAQRRRNVRRAFELRGAARYGRIAIIDDVITTAATVTELSRLLKRAGVREVQVWAVAHAD